MKAVFVEQTGGIDALKYGDFPAPQPGPGEVLVKIAYSGVNFIDTYHRSGLYKLPLPAVIGSEASGKVEKLGEGVTGFKPGDRVAYTLARGSYAEFHSVPAVQLVKIPDNVDDATAAACMLQGCTAHYLTHSTFVLKKGQTALVHAAAGGTGRLIVQMAAMIGARVIATVGSEAKAKLTLGDGASDAILYNSQDFVAEDQAADRRPGRRGGLRRRRPGDISQGLRLPEAARHDGGLRQCERSRGSFRSAAAQPEGIAVRDAADLVHLHGQPRRPGMAHVRPVPLDRRGQGQNQHR